MTERIEGRISWDTAIKHLARQEILQHILTPQQINQIPSSNISRWKQESDLKYQFCEVNQLVKQEIELIKKINQSSKIKQINQSYFKLCDAFAQIISKVKGIPKIINQQKELIVNTVDSVKDYISINAALKVFNISRSTFQYYKVIVIHRCEGSYFQWSSKTFAQQLIPKEVKVIKQYMVNEDFKYWSKCSIYAMAIRDGALACELATFYKYCQLLGFSKSRQPHKKPNYSPLKTTSPNQTWCSDVTIFKTADGHKHYIHILMDHFSKMILGYRVVNHNSGKAIKEILQEAYIKQHPKEVKFLSDGGSDNNNHTVANFLSSCSPPISHQIAQKDVVFSNSMIEALNKVIKYQFLYPKGIQKS